MTKELSVQLTANFERNLASIEQFWIEAGATNSYDDLINVLLDTIVPNLERFPDIGRSFLARKIASAEALRAIEGLRLKEAANGLREYVLTDYVVLYTRAGDIIYLLAVKHHRQLSFDFNGLWGNS